MNIKTITGIQVAELGQAHQVCGGVKYVCCMADYN